MATVRAYDQHALFTAGYMHVVNRNGEAMFNTFCVVYRGNRIQGIGELNYSVCGTDLWRISIEGLLSFSPMPHAFFNSSMAVGRLQKP